MIDRKKLERLVWRHTHRDFRGGTKDARTVLHNVTGVGTCVVSIAKLTEAELLDKLPRAVRAELEPK